MCILDTVTNTNSAILSK